MVRLDQSFFDDDGDVEMADYVVGKKMMIKGLRKRELNGKIATIMSHKSMSDGLFERLNVIVQGYPNRTFAIRVDNLWEIEDQKEEEPPSDSEDPIIKQFREMEEQRKKYENRKKEEDRKRKREREEEERYEKKQKEDEKQEEARKKEREAQERKARQEREEKMRKEFQRKERERVQREREQKREEERRQQKMKEEAEMRDREKSDSVQQERDNLSSGNVRNCPAYTIDDDAINQIACDDKKQSRKLVIKLHPDRNTGCPNLAGEKMRLFNSRCKASDAEYDDDWHRSGSKFHRF